MDHLQCHGVDKLAANAIFHAPQIQRVFSHWQCLNPSNQYKEEGYLFIGKKGLGMRIRHVMMKNKMMKRRRSLHQAQRRKHTKLTQKRREKKKDHRPLTTTLHRYKQLTQEMKDAKVDKEESWIQ